MQKQFKVIWELRTIKHNKSNNKQNPTVTKSTPNTCILPLTLSILGIIVLCTGYYIFYHNYLFKSSCLICKQTSTNLQMWNIIFPQVILKSKTVIWECLLMWVFYHGFFWLLCGYPFFLLGFLARMKSKQ